MSVCIKTMEDSKALPFSTQMEKLIEIQSRPLLRLRMMRVCAVVDGGSMLCVVLKNLILQTRRCVHAGQYSSVDLHHFYA